MLWTCAVFATVPLLGAGQTTAFLIVSVLTGICLGADLALPPAMQADVIDLDTARTRQQRAGFFFALWGMATKLALAAAVGIAYPLLDLAGFDPAAAQNDRGALFALAALYRLGAGCLQAGRNRGDVALPDHGGASGTLASPDHAPHIMRAFSSLHKDFRPWFPSRSVLASSVTASWVNGCCAPR